ncbi:aminotransferase class V-fold PLP-dependent enzyme [Rubrivirga sp. IMCC45206]|uniref:aminotransferase class V-fold PLP-dependent enzyme n=1 Tax=Rubrivirga sp. IMCC45206 TaxID=3391614 RepID=UPI00398FDB5F
MTLDAYRALFDAPAAGVYLDHAAIGVLGQHVADAVSGYVAKRAGQTPGLAPNDYPADLERADRARERGGALVNATREQVCIVPNTSAGLNLVVQGLDWRPGDRVAVPSCEFPANRLPWLGLAHRGVEVDAIDHREGTFMPDDVAAAIRPETRVVAVSAVQFLSGFRCDLAAIAEVCRQHDVLFVVDAIQAAGAVRVDAGLADLVTFGGHKWLGSLQGAGLAVVSDRLRDRLVPARGWLNGPVDWDDFEAVSLDLHPDASRFHLGTFPTAALYALDAALGAMLALGLDELERAVLANAARLASGLDALGFRRYGPLGTPASGIVTVHADDPVPLHAHLAASGIFASLRDRKLRFAVHAQTRPEAIDRALDTVAAFTPQIA